MRLVRDVLAAALVAAVSMGCPMTTTRIYTTAPDRTNPAIEALWHEQGGASGWMGAATSNVADIPDGQLQHFEHADITWSQATGAHFIKEPLRAAAIPWQTTGLPTGNDTPGPGKSTLVPLSRGTLYHSAETGAHVVSGTIRDTYVATGAEQGSLGLPTTDEETTPTGARVQRFAGGVVATSATTGTHVVTGPAYEAYSASGGVGGALGLPTADESTVVDRVRVASFQGGVVTYEQGHKPVAVAGAIATEYGNRKGTAGPLGLPSGPQYAVAGGYAQDFAGGRIEYSNGVTKVQTLDERCYTGHVICVSKSDRKLRWVVDGRPVTVMDMRVGDPVHTTPEGSFSIFMKVRNEWSYLHNSAMPFAMYFREGGFAVHYSGEFAAEGWDGVSHGCVNTRDYDTMGWLFEQAQIGDRVVIYP